LPEALSTALFADDDGRQATQVWNRRRESSSIWRSIRQCLDLRSAIDESDLVAVEWKEFGSASILCRPERRFFVRSRPSEK